MTLPKDMTAVGYWSEERLAAIPRRLNANQLARAAAAREELAELRHPGPYRYEIVVGRDGRERIRVKG